MKKMSGSNCANLRIQEQKHYEKLLSIDLTIAFAREKLCEGAESMDLIAASLDRLAVLSRSVCAQIQSNNELLSTEEISVVSYRAGDKLGV